MSILQKILKEKKKEVIQLKEKSFPTSNDQKQKSSFKQQVLTKDHMHVIAEIKRASPSKGIIANDINPVERAITYEKLGASAISVLTDKTFFKGSFADLRAVSESVNIPVLCKDFIIDHVQIDQAKDSGADMILLIVAALEDDQLKELVHYATTLQLEVLCEVHNIEEMNRALDLGATIIGINNRDLNTFTVDLNTTTQLSAIVKDPNIILISESGIQTKNDVLHVTDAGVNAILVGETLMRSTDLPTTFNDLHFPLQRKVR